VSRTVLALLLIVTAIPLAALSMRSGYTRWGLFSLAWAALGAGIVAFLDPPTGMVIGVWALLALNVATVASLALGYENDRPGRRDQ
jgi:hypothetical protein